MKLIASFFLALMLNFSSIAQSEFSSSTISIGVVVSDLQKSVDFYTNVVGMTKTGSFNLDEAGGRRTGLTGGEPFSVTVLKLIDDDSGTQWKLMSFSKDASHPKQKYIQDDTGMQYITIMVNKLSPFVERIKKNNVEMLGETPFVIGGTNSFVLIQDPDGNFIELIGPMD